MSGLPAWIGAALDGQLELVSRAALRQRARTISEGYRAGGGSDAIRTELDALAYALARMPATYAAVAAALTQTAPILPDLAPQSVLDIGAGPGTATWAAIEAWPSLRQAHLLDRSGPLLSLARSLGETRGAPPVDVSVTAGDFAGALGGAGNADVVIASYALGEVPPDLARSLLARLWALANRLLVLVEPGTPAGFRRVLEYRARLLAQGATIVAPCSHEGACPLADDARWCHFGVRLPRSRDHVFIKDASVPYEDEKFAYLVAAKGIGAPARGRRILATPTLTKAGITLTLCAPDQVAKRTVARRQKDAYKAAKRCRWGDALAASDH